MGWEEWRPEERLVRLAQAHPERYQRDDAGRWHFVPGERFVEPLGLFFRLRSSAEISSIARPEPHLSAGLLPLRRTSHSFLHGRRKRRRVRHEPGVSLAQLLKEVRCRRPLQHDRPRPRCRGPICVPPHRGRACSGFR